MNRLFRIASISTALALSSLAASAAEPGFVDLGKLKPAEGCDFVEINLGGPLLRFASSFVKHENPDVAALIRGLKHVRVNVVGYDETNRADTTGRVESLRQELEQQGWTRMVTAKEGGKGGDVAIYVRTAADESIEGIVVTVLDASGKQAVFVNVVGNINPDQLAAVGRGLGIDSLAQVPTVAAPKRT